jgi:ADP-ribose pyrophosphatase YjhB (NUDIX family)
MDMIQTLAKLKALVDTSLYYTKDAYDKERLEEMKTLLLDLAQETTSYSIEELEPFFNEELGYVTPKVDVRAIVFHDNQLLLVKEKMEESWSLPGGWADIGYSASEIAKKEVKEESGLEVTPVSLFKVIDKAKHSYPRSLNYVYKIFFYCITDNFAVETGLETSEARFFTREEILALDNISFARNTLEDLLDAFEYHKHPFPGAQFD